MIMSTLRVFSTLGGGGGGGGDMSTSGNYHDYIRDYQHIRGEGCIMIHMGVS